MSVPAHATFALSLDDSLAFAELSGDFNPLHIDPVAARRTQFGGTVVHGIHAVLRALDALADAWQQPGLEPTALGATFHHPVRTGVVVDVTAAAIPDGRIRLTAESGGRPAFTLNVRCEAADGDAGRTPAAGRFARQAPHALPFPPPPVDREIPVRLDAALLSQLLPRLADPTAAAWIADLLASTRIVGMECPGLHSIYSGFKLQRTDVRDRSGRDPVMRYSIQKVDPRFRQARLAVAGLHFAGTLDTFFRPPAVMQRSLRAIAQETPSGWAAGQRALVVGGSRGLGEIAAKVLLAGDALVTVTYVRGRDDAERLQSEAADLGRRCEIAALDASQPLPEATRAWLTAGRYTHVYFFASPHIERNAGRHWDAELFDRYASVYVRGYTEIVEAVAASRTGDSGAALKVLYPSSVFLDKYEPGFAEYCAAKAAGEMAGLYMTHSLHAIVAAPRLPRMRTDQTSALMDVGSDDPYPVISQVVRGLSA